MRKRLVAALLAAGMLTGAVASTASRPAGPAPAAAEVRAGKHSRLLVGK